VLNTKATKNTFTERCLKAEFKAEGVYRASGNKNNKSHYKTKYILKTNGLSLNYY